MGLETSLKHLMKEMVPKSRMLLQDLCLLSELPQYKYLTFIKPGPSSAPGHPVPKTSHLEKEFLSRVSPCVFVDASVGNVIHSDKLL